MSEWSEEGQDTRNCSSGHGGGGVRLGEGKEDMGQRGGSWELHDPWGGLMMPLLPELRPAGTRRAGGGAVGVFKERTARAFQPTTGTRGL